MLYRSFDEYVKLIQTQMVADMKAKAEKQGIKILALDYIYGFRNLITQKVITTPADFKVMNIRTPGSKSYIDTLTAMGAVATPLPWGERWRYFSVSLFEYSSIKRLNGNMCPSF